MTEEKSKPIKKFKAGAIDLAVWEQEGKDDKGNFITISLQRNYKDKEGNWKHTQTLRVNDLPVVGLLLRRAFEFAKMDYAPSKVSPPKAEEVAPVTETVQ